MQDIRKKPSSFGGLTVLLAGDWRQILPVVRHKTRPDVVDAKLKSSYLLQIVTRLPLTQNMRAKLRGESSQFADCLLSIEGGKEEHHKDKGHFFIKLPDDMTVENEKELLDYVFGGIENNCTDSAWLSSRSIIGPINSEVDAINNSIMSIFPYLHHWCDNSLWTPCWKASMHSQNPNDTLRQHLPLSHEKKAIFCSTCLCHHF